MGKIKNKNKEKVIKEEQSKMVEEKRNGKDEKASAKTGEKSKKSGVSDLASTLNKLIKLKDIASKVIDVGKTVANVAKEIGKDFIDMTTKAVKASLELKKISQQKGKDKKSSAKSIGGSNDSGASGLFDKLDKFKIIASTVSQVGLTVANVAKDIGSAFIDMTTKTAEASLEIEKISQKTGLSTTQLQELKYVASQTGVEFSNIQSAAISMGESMTLAQGGNNAQAEAFKKLGISLEDAQGNLVSADEAFNQVIMKLANMADETERNALATQIFGSSATELTPLLEEGGEELQKYKDRANELGLVMSEKTIESNAKFAETMGTMKETIGNLRSEFNQVGEAVMYQIGSAVIPILQTLFDWILRNMPMIQEVTGTVFSIIGESVGFFIELIKQLINWITEWAKNNEEKLNMVKEMFMAWFKAIKAEIEFFVSVIEKVAKYIMELWRQHGEDIIAVLQNAWDVIAAIIDTAIKLITNIFNIFASLFKGDWEGLWNGIKQLFSDIWQGIGNVIDEYIEYLKSTIKLGLEFIKNIFSDIWGGIKDTVTGIWEGIVDGIKGSINKILRAINKMIRGMNKLKINIPNWIPKIGGKSWGFNIPTIPLLAEGTDYFKGGFAIVGEKGPELLQLPRGAKVYSNTETQSILSKGGITQNITINSPQPLSPSAIKRKTLEASRQLAMEWGV